MQNRLLVITIILLLIVYSACSLSLQGDNGLTVAGNSTSNTVTLALDGTVVRGVLTDSGNATGSDNWLSMLGAGNVTVSASGSTITITADLGNGTSTYALDSDKLDGQHGSYYLTTTGTAADSTLFYGFTALQWTSAMDAIAAAATSADSDKLDGQHGSYYLSTTGTAADSDKLDGLHGSSYLTQSPFVFSPQTAAAVEINVGATTPMTCLINGNPTTTSVVYDTDSAEVRVNSRLGRLVLWNSTRGTSRLVISNDETINTFTTVLTVDAWANNDVLTMLSQVVGHAYVDVEMISASSPVIPAAATALKVEVLLMEQTTLGANEDVILHPMVVWAVGQEQYMKVQVLGKFNQFVTDVPLTNGHISFSVRAATKMYLVIQVIGYWN